jgi:hypothetical protein
MPIHPPDCPPECPCPRHPFCCYGHPHDCGCRARVVAQYETEAKSDLAAARRAIADFEKNGGTSLEALKRELGME